MKKLITILILMVFLFQIGFLTYRVPQILLTGSKFPDEVKLSAVIAGLCLGVLYFLKGYKSPFE